jgi:sortase A
VKKKLLSSKKVKLIAIVLIVIGLGIALRPFYLAWRFDRLQKNMLDMWQTTNEFQADASRAGWSSSVAVVGGGNSDVWEEDTNPDIDVNYIVNNMDGVITIKKINLSVPIINKYTINNLNISVCSAIEKNKMGQAGNYVLAGHRSRIRGRHFNRIIELEPGDLIVTENKEAKYTYRVDDIFLITPDETWVMDDDGDKKLITLITCDYRMEPTGRLIVRGELASSEPADGTL